MSSASDEETSDTRCLLSAPIILSPCKNLHRRQATSLQTQLHSRNGVTHPLHLPLSIWFRSALLEAFLLARLSPSRLSSTSGVQARRISFYFSSLTTRFRFLVCNNQKLQKKIRTARSRLGCWKGINRCRLRSARCCVYDLWKILFYCYAVFYGWTHLPLPCSLSCFFCLLCALCKSFAALAASSRRVWALAFLIYSANTNLIPLLPRTMNRRDFSPGTPRPSTEIKHSV